MEVKSDKTAGLVLAFKQPEAQPAALANDRGSVNKEVIAELEALLEEARAGELTGLAYAALYREAFTVELVGSAMQRPTLTRGMIAALDDLVRDRAPRAV